MHNVSKAAQLMGRAGGKAGTGKSKARTSQQARAAINARWAKHKSKRERRTKQ